MKIYFFKSLSYLIILTFVFSCTSDDFIDTDNMTDTSNKEISCEMFEDNLVLDKSSAVSSKTLFLIGETDTDGDGISDYAEKLIEGFNPDKYDNYVMMNPNTVLKVRTARGIQSVPLYKMSFYQNNMMDFTISSFSDNAIFNGNKFSPWTKIQKDKCSYVYPRLKKIFLSQEFRDFIYAQFGNDNRANDFYYKLMEVKRDFQLVHSLSSAGFSNKRSAIGIAPWVMDDEFSDYHLANVFAHELVHHLGFDHNGIPYGIHDKIREMFSSKKYDYEVFDAEDINNYISDTLCDKVITKIYPETGKAYTLAVIPAYTSLAHFQLKWQTRCYNTSASVSFIVNPDSGKITVESFRDSEGRGVNKIQYINDSGFRTPYLSGVQFQYDKVTREVRVLGLKNGCGYSGANLGMSGCWKTISCNTGIPKIYPGVGQESVIATVSSASLAYFQLNWHTRCYNIRASVGFVVNPNSGKITVESFSDSEGKGVDKIQYINDSGFRTPYLSGVQFQYDKNSRKVIVLGLKNGCGYSGANLGMSGSWGD